MIIKKEKRIVEVEDLIYIANDGAEFRTETECKDHEKDIEDEKIRTKAEMYEIKELRGFFPLNVRGEISKYCSYIWYKVNSNEELNSVANLYEADFGEFGVYPQIICVEMCYSEDYAYVHPLLDMKDQTIQFWKRLGFDVSFLPRISAAVEEL